MLDNGKNQQYIMADKRDKDKGIDFITGQLNRRCLYMLRKIYHAYVESVKMQMKYRNDFKFFN